MTRHRDHRDDDERDYATDLQHLRLLSIFYYVLSGLAALCALFPVIHLVIGILVVAGAITWTKVFQLKEEWQKDK